jgi:RimJ/RimL family protein N-acetyltransferase
MNESRPEELEERLRFSALKRGAITLHRITEENEAWLRTELARFPDAEYMIGELNDSYLPGHDKHGRLTKLGFYATLDGLLAGMSLLGIGSWHDMRGYTGADTLTHMRGRGVAPGSKPHLFYVGFYLLGLNRIETGCFVSNLSSKRSLEKTPGLVREGTLRQYARNLQGEFEDEYRYSILRADWLSLYDPAEIEILP